MGKFAEFCKGETMGAFLLLLLPARSALPVVAEDQAGRHPTVRGHRFYGRSGTGAPSARGHAARGRAPLRGTAPYALGRPGAGHAGAAAGPAAPVATDAGLCGAGVLGRAGAVLPGEVPRLDGAGSSPGRRLRRLAARHGASKRLTRSHSAEPSHALPAGKTLILFRMDLNQERPAR
jgi:hypothetical protein